MPLVLLFGILLSILALLYPASLTASFLPP
nr:MAG TPA: hypothetical protein [Crassvirales sp.]